MSANEHYLLIFDITSKVKSKLYRYIQAVLVVVYIALESFLNGNLIEMHGK